ncbi:MAG: transcriptional repressor [Thermoanaerobaculum sp.]|nr:transcriptional repressor [Thermoanaerobaculum sp.]MDW7967142.1 transcriptional repressor [Thermoanaerobaculum sp.]
MDVARASRQFAKYLRENNLKVTKERLMLLEELLTSEGHFDADTLLFQIRQRGKKASRATVYRTLELLVQCGLARKSRLGREHYVYEKVTPGPRHDHMVCVQCGKITEFYDGQLEERQRQLCQEHGFRPTYIALQIHGVCAACRAAEER